MKNNLLVFILLFWALLFVNTQSYAQIKVAGYAETGKNQVSEGILVAAAILPSYEFHEFTFSGGLQFDIYNGSPNFVSGYLLKTAYELPLKHHKSEIEAFYVYNPFSDILYESNFGGMIKYHSHHFSYMIGTNFRTYGYSKQAIEDFALSENTKIHENFNVIYSLGYNLKPEEHDWNIGLVLTNFDDFIINQETNPVFFLKGNYKLNSKLEIFAEFWYKTAGAFNIRVNYFGYNIRTGLQWKI